MGRRRRGNIELIELIEPDDQGWDAVASSAYRGTSGSTGSTAPAGRGRWRLVATGLAASFGLGVVVQGIAFRDGGDGAPAPPTTQAPATTASPSTTAALPIDVVDPPPGTTPRLSPLLVDVPGMIAVAEEVNDRSARDSFSPPVVVYHHPLTGETLRLGDIPRTAPRVVSRVDLGDGLVGLESRIGDVTTVILEGSGPQRAVIGTASTDMLRLVLVTAARGGATAGDLTALGFVIRRSANIDGLWAGADEATVYYLPINDLRDTPWNDRPWLSVSQLRQTGISEPWALVLPQRFDVPGGTAYGGYLDSQAVLGVQLADQVVVLRGTGFSLDQLVAAAATLRPARAGEWGEIQSGTRQRASAAGAGVLTPIDSGVMVGGTPWATESLGDFGGVDSWGAQAGSATGFVYLGINRVERPLLISTVVEGATAVLAIAPRDGVYQLRVLFGDGVQLDLPLRAIGDDVDWQARSYMWSELGPWSAAIVDVDGTVAATLEPTQ